jgi:hypothetical protein
VIKIEEKNYNWIVFLSIGLIVGAVLGYLAYENELFKKEAIGGIKTQQKQVITEPNELELKQFIQERAKVAKESDLEPSNPPDLPTTFSCVWWEYWPPVVIRFSTNMACGFANLACKEFGASMLSCNG